MLAAQRLELATPDRARKPGRHARCRDAGKAEPIQQAGRNANALRERAAHRVADAYAQGLNITIDGAHAASIASRLKEDEIILDRTADTVTILLPIFFASRGAKQKIVPAGSRPPQPDPVLIAALRKAQSMLRTEPGMPTMATAPSSPYDRNILRLAFLAPDIQRAILDGRQPLHLNLETLKKLAIPLTWSKQRKALGIGETDAPCSGE